MSRSNRIDFSSMRCPHCGNRSLKKVDDYFVCNNCNAEVDLFELYEYTGGIAINSSSNKDKRNKVNENN